MSFRGVALALAASLAKNLGELIEGYCTLMTFTARVLFRFVYFL